jgi:hypothetical protein
MARPPSAAMTPIPSARGAVRSWEFYRTGAGGFDSMDGPSVVLVHGTREDGLASSTGAPRSAQIWCVASSSLQSTARARTASTAGHLRPQAPWALRRSVPRSTPACSSPRPVRQGRPPCARLDVGPRRGHRLGSLGQRSRVRPAPGRPNHAALLRMAGITHPGLVAKGNGDPMMPPHYCYLDVPARIQLGPAGARPGRQSGGVQTESRPGPLRLHVWADAGQGGASRLNSAATKRGKRQQPAGPAGHHSTSGPPCRGRTLARCASRSAFNFPGADDDS